MSFTSSLLTDFFLVMRGWNSVSTQENKKSLHALSIIKIEIPFKRGKIVIFVNSDILLCGSLLKTRKENKVGKKC